MRIQVPALPQDRPTNPSDTLAGRWYATINNNNNHKKNNNNNRHDDEHDDNNDDDRESHHSDEMRKKKQQPVLARHNLGPKHHHDTTFRDNFPSRATNTLGDFIVHNHRVMNQFGLRYEDLPQGYQQQPQPQQQPQQQQQPVQPQHYGSRNYYSSREELTATPSISSAEDMVRAGMQPSQESGTSDPQLTSSSTSPQIISENPYIDFPILLSETGRRKSMEREFNNHNTTKSANDICRQPQPRRPRSRSPTPDIFLLRRYREQTQQRLEEKMGKKEQQQNETIEKDENMGWEQQQHHFNQPQHDLLHREPNIRRQIPITGTIRPLPPPSLSSSDRHHQKSSSSNSRLRKTSTLSSGSYAPHTPQLWSNNTLSSTPLNNHNFNNQSINIHDDARSSVETLQRDNFDQGRRYPHQHNNNTSTVKKEASIFDSNPSRNSRLLWAVGNELGGNQQQDDPVDCERRRHEEEERLWKDGNSQILDHFSRPDVREADRYDQYASAPHSQAFERRDAPPIVFDEPDPIFEAHMDYFDDGIILQPSAFDTIRPDGYRMFPNRALADANESLASTLPPHDFNYQHPYAYRPPPPDRSCRDIHCSPNPTPVSPLNQQQSSPSAAVAVLVQTSRSTFSLLGNNLIPGGCTPMVGNFSKAIAPKDDEEEEVKSKKSIWEFLDPNNDLSGYDEGSSDGSSAENNARSPRKSDSTRKRSSYDENSHHRRIEEDDRYDRQKLSSNQETMQDLRSSSPHACQERTAAGFANERESSLEHRKQQLEHQQPFYKGQDSSHPLEPYDDLLQNQENDQFVSDFEPFEENIHDAIWGSEESPDPIFSSTDPRNMREKRTRPFHHSTGGFMGKSILPQEKNRRRTTDPTPHLKPAYRTAEIHETRPKSTGRGGRELGMSTKQNRRNDKNGQKSTKPRSQSTGRGERVENFLQLLTGQNRKQPNMDGRTKPKDIERHSRSGSTTRPGQGNKRSIDTDNTNDQRRRSRSGSNRDSQRSRTRLSEESSPWADIDTFSQDFGSTKDFFDDDRRVRSGMEDNRIQKKLDQVRERSFRNAERLQSFDGLSGPAQNQDMPRKWSSSLRTPRKSLSPGKGRMPQQRLENKCDDAVTNQASPWRPKEDNDGPYMYVAYSRFSDDAERVLHLCEHQTLPEPSSRNGEVLVRVEASTVSNSDCAIRRGEWSKMVLNPYIIPGVAMVGRVYSDGRKRQSNSSFSFSSPIKPGDMVLSLMSSGANARYACLPKAHLVKVPPRVNLDKAVCLVETYLTAFQVLHIGHRGTSRYQDYSLDGRSILILGGYSALGRALIELSIAGGAQYCYASACQVHQRTGNGNSGSIPTARRQFETLTRWGAIPLSSDPQDWLTLIGRQIDLMITVYDPSERALYNEVVSDDHCKALRKDGQVIVICTHPGMSKNEERDDIFVNRPTVSRNNINPFRIPAFRTTPRDKLIEDRTVWYNVFDSWERNNGTGGKVVAKKDLEHLLELLEQERLNPDVLERLPLSKIGKAQFILENKRLTGHLVCAPWLKQQNTVLTPAMTGRRRG